MNIAELFSLVRRNFLQIILWGIGGLIILFIVAAVFITPKYNSSIDILVNQKTDDTQAQYTAQQTDLHAISTYKDILKKSVILQPVLNKLKEKDNYSGTIDDLEKAVSIDNEADSLIMTVSVRDTNAYVAKDAANIIGSVFSTKIKKMMKIDNVAIVSKAKLDPEVVFPNKTLFALVGLILGLLCGLVVSFVRELLDTTIKDNDYLCEDLGLVNLGMIYHIPSNDNSFHMVYVKKKENDDTLGNSAQSRRRV